MVKRTCPACGATRYSADDSGTWVCECGRWLTPELNEIPGKAAAVVCGAAVDRKSKQPKEEKR